LLLSCVYSREVWFKCLRRCRWQHLAPSVEDCLIPWWLHARKSVAKARRKAFDTLVILIAWNLWLEHNDRVVRSVSSLPSCLVSAIWSMALVYSTGRLLWVSIDCCSCCILVESSGAPAFVKLSILLNTTRVWHDIEKNALSVRH
jgi:hypothetical protein